MSILKLRAVARHVGAEIVDPPPLTDCDDEVVAEIKEALAAHGVVFMHTDTLDPHLHLAFARRFGEIHPPSVLIETLASLGCPEIGVISTENKLAYSSNFWHSDVTWMPEPTQYSILHMQQTPDIGGDTMWACQSAAYDALSDRMKAYLDGLSALHMPVTQSPLSAVHPMVVRHPRTGRRTIFANTLFTRQIEGVDREESDAVLSYLRVHTSRPEFVCRWKWTNGDIAIWDNHYVQHYASGDYHPAPRKIHRIEIKGHAPYPA